MERKDSLKMCQGGFQILLGSPEKKEKGELFLEEKCLSFVLDFRLVRFVLDFDLHPEWLSGRTPGSDLRDHF